MRKRIRTWVASDEFFNNSTCCLLWVKSVIRECEGAGPFAEYELTEDERE